MNNHIYPLFLVLLLFFSGCNDIDDPQPENLNFFEDKFSIILEDSLKITYDQMEMYDYSTHMIYLKDKLPFMSEFESSGIFRIVADGEEIYSGQLFPAWFSSIPQGPFIWIPPFYPDYVIKLDYHQNLDPSEDLRKDNRIMNALKETGLYHNGLEFQIDKIALQKNTVDLHFTIINNDSFDYYILSPDKMGVNLFHYYTTGLYLSKEGGTYLNHHVEVSPPEPWNSWNIQWMDLLLSGKSKTYTLTYDNFDFVEPGNYNIYFNFPGLGHQVSEQDLIRPEGRIWLGELNFKDNMDLP